MRTIDFSPLFRNSVGFDRMQSMLDTVSRTDAATQSYPPYDIESLSENDYQITMAVAGFSADDIEITAQENTLIISGKALNENEQDTYLHRGIARRAFERRFQLADNVKVTTSTMENGLLHVQLVREIPEEQKPRRIEINTAVPKQTKAIESKKAA